MSTSLRKIESSRRNSLLAAEANRVVRDKNWLMRFVSIDPSGCWNWTSTKNTKGYGKFVISVTNNGIAESKMHFAHRYAYKIFFGDFNTKMWVLHRCDNPSCVNPDHLFLGTAQDNADDRDRKGRWKHNGIHGTKHWSATLSESTVFKIKKMINEGVRLVDISKKLDVKYQTVVNIRVGTSYRHTRTLGPTT